MTDVHLFRWVSCCACASQYSSYLVLFTAVCVLLSQPNGHTSGAARDTCGVVRCGWYTVFSRVVRFPTFLPMTRIYMYEVYARLWCRTVRYRCYCVFFACATMTVLWRFSAKMLAQGVFAQEKVKKCACRSQVQAGRITQGQKVSPTQYDEYQRK